MAVPNTTTFKLSQVIAAVAGAQTSLNGCVTDATGASYDATYYTAPATRMLEFRNYDEGGDSLSLSDNGTNTNSAAGNINVTVTSNTTWTVSSDSAWLTFSGNANTGNDLFNIAWTANGGGARTGIITVAWSGTNATYTVQQAA